MFRLWWDFRITTESNDKEKRATKTITQLPTMVIDGNQSINGNQSPSPSPDQLKTFPVPFDDNNSAVSVASDNSQNGCGDPEQQVKPQQTKGSMRASSKILTWCTLICYAIFIGYVLLSRFYVFIIKEDEVNIPCILWVSPQIISFMSGRMFLYLLWYDRFHAAFKSSAFGKSCLFSWFISVGIVISMVISMIFYLIIYMIYADNYCQLSGDGHLIIAALPFTIFDLVWSVIILYLFIGHLSKLLYLSISLNNKLGDIEIFNLIKKLNILVNVSVLSTWIIFITIYSFAALSASTIDCCINTICILLTFRKYNENYEKICFLCIDYYQSCFMKWCCCCCKLCHKVDKAMENNINMLTLTVETR